MDDPELWPAPGALPERGREIELFVRASSTEPDCGKAHPNPEELQPKQYGNLSPEREFFGHGQEHEEDDGCKKAEKAACQYFIFSPNYDSSAG